MHLIMMTGEPLTGHLLLQADFEHHRRLLCLAKLSAHAATSSASSGVTAAPAPTSDAPGPSASRALALLELQRRLGLTSTGALGLPALVDAALGLARGAAGAGAAGGAHEAALMALEAMASGTHQEREANK